MSDIKECEEYQYPFDNENTTVEEYTEEINGIKKQVVNLQRLLKDFQKELKNTKCESYENELDENIQGLEEAIDELRTKQVKLGVDRLQKGLKDGTYPFPKQWDAMPVTNKAEAKAKAKAKEAAARAEANAIEAAYADRDISRGAAGSGR